MSREPGIRVLPDAIYTPDEAMKILNRPSLKQLYRLPVRWVPVTPGGRKRVYRGRDLLDYLDREGMV